MALLTDEQKKELASIGSDNYTELEELRKKRNDRFNTNWVDHDYAEKLEEKRDWQQNSQPKLTEEERKALKKAEKEKWELTGALYAAFAMVVCGACFYYFGIRRKRLR